MDGNNLPPKGTGADESAAAWDAFMKEFNAYMRPAVTSVAVCPYTVGMDGSFTYLLQKTLVLSVASIGVKLWWIILY